MTCTTCWSGWDFGIIDIGNGPGRALHCQTNNHVQQNLNPPILYAIDNSKNYDFFFYIYITIDNIF